MYLGEAEQIPENITENAVGSKVATLAPFEGGGEQGERDEVEGEERG